MPKYEYVCLSCGNYSRLKASSLKKQKGYACPHCKSTNVLKLERASLFEVPGGG